MLTDILLFDQFSNAVCSIMIFLILTLFSMGFFMHVQKHEEGLKLHFG